MRLAAAAKCGFYPAHPNAIVACERTIYIEHIAEPEDGDPEGQVFVTLCTHPQPETSE